MTGRRKVWMFAPHSGGSRIPPALQEETRRRILAHANKHYGGGFDRIDVWFRGQFCYIDAYQDGNTVPTHLCRLRYFSGHGEWSVAFYMYSHERYEPSFFASGEALGTPEEGFDVGAVYLR
jgi:hypothetical protein